MPSLAKASLRPRELAYGYRLPWCLLQWLRLGKDRFVADKKLFD